MGRILNRYVFLEILVPFFLGLGVFTFVLLIARILKLVEMVVNRGVPLVEMLKIFSYILPAFLEVTVPMALLLSILLGFGRLSADSEVVALKTSGVSLYQMMLPVGVFVALASMLTLLMTLTVSPWSNGALKRELFEVVRSRASAGFKEKVFNTDFPGFIIYVDEIETGGATLKGVLLSDVHDPGRRSTIVAKIGLLLPNPDTQTFTVRLLDGTIFEAEPSGKSLQKTDFNVYDVSLNLVSLMDMRSQSKDPKEMGLAELRARIHAKAAAGEPAAKERVELQRKFSIPFACIVFALVGLPLAIQPARAVRSRGFSVALLLIFLYYIPLTLCQTFAEKGRMPPALALWTPNAIFLGLGVWLLRRAARELPILDWIERAWWALRGRLPGWSRAMGTS